MIFISVGTTPFPFQRMVLLVQNLLRRRVNNERIIFQFGTCDVSVLEGKPNIDLHSELSFPAMQKYMKSAKVVIVQGGPAAIFQCLSFWKMPHVFPRDPRFGEHINNHQVLFAKFMQSQKMVQVVDLNSRVNSVKPVCNYRPGLKRKMRLVNYLDSIANSI